MRYFRRALGVFHVMLLLVVKFLCYACVRGACVRASAENGAPGVSLQSAPHSLSHGFAVLEGLHRLPAPIIAGFCCRDVVDCVACSACCSDVVVGSILPQGSHNLPPD